MTCSQLHMLLILIATKHHGLHERVGNWSRQAEVADADLAVGLDEDVGRLDVAVHHVRRVQEVERAQRVVKDTSHVVLVERNLGRRAEDLFEVRSGVVHDDEQIVELFALLDAR